MTGVAEPDIAAPQGNTVPVEPYLRWGLAALATAAAAIHFAVMFEHFTQSVLFGVFFLVIAWLQLGWAAAVGWRPTRAVLWAGMLANGGILVVYLLSRTTGVPIGPDPGQAEPVGGLDVVCAVLEVALLAGTAVLLLRRLAGRQVVARRARVALIGGIALVVAATTAVFTPALAGAEGPAGMTAAMTPPMTPPMTQPMPGAGGAASDQMPGMKEVGPTSPPTAAQIAAADQLIQQTRAGIARYADVQAAIADGYRPLREVQTGNETHYINEALVPDGLDPQHPQSLVYANVPGHAPVLLGAMYLAAPNTNGPDVGGSLTRWHEHLLQCVNGVMHISNFVTTARCTARLAANGTRYTAQMLHVWTAPNYPGGPFSDDLSPQAIQTAAQQVLSGNNN